MASGKSWTKSLFTGLWSVLNFTRVLFFNIVFIIIVIGLFVIIGSADDDQVKVPEKTALILDLRGDLVIQKRGIDPFEEFMQEAFEQQEENPEVLMRDLLMAIDNAQHDKRIQALVLDLHGLGRAGLDKLQQIAAALEKFKASEKPIYAIGDYFSQNQYYLASHADHVYLNPMGGMMIEGYGRYPMYFKSALENLKASTHIFRVGTFKSAVEPYMRDDMSDAAREANAAWLGSLWQQYKQDVAKARNLSEQSFDESLDQFLPKFAESDNNFAQYALDNGWVDALKTREDVRSELAEIVGRDKSKLGFSAINLKNYLKVINPPFPVQDNGMDKVGIVLAKGAIMNGNQKPGTIGGDSTAKLLRKARLDDSVKAVVMQVDSPGGSAFASEVIRQEVDLLRAAGKPVVVSMSTYAASGGYWISASADEIWAAPSTITGSIGIFGMFMTFENTLDYLGLHSDGVGTTDFSGFSPTRALDPRISTLVQRNIESSYDKFIGLVSEQREMSVSDVDEIAQGRVWIGDTALNLGLVDKLGYLDDAVASAAKLAELDTYDTKYVQRSLSAKEKFWKEFFGQAAVVFAKAHFADSDSHLMGLVKQLVKEFDHLAKFNDPMGAYAYCLSCEI